MSDFMREVDEEYRRERAMQFLSRYQLLIVLVLVALVAGAGFWQIMRDRRIASAQADDSRFQGADKAARDGQAAASVKDFDGIAADGVGGYPLLAGMRAAEELAATDPEGAAKRFDAIASGEGSAALRDTARYRGALLRVDRLEPKKFEDLYGRFAIEDFTFKSGMRELLALASLKGGDAVKAQKYLGDIVIDPTAPSPLRGRAQAFLELARSGAAAATDKAVPATVTAAAGAPEAAASPAPSVTPPAAPPVATTPEPSPTAPQ